MHTLHVYHKCLDLGFGFCSICPCSGTQADAVSTNAESLVIRKGRRKWQITDQFLKVSTQMSHSHSYSHPIGQCKSHVSNFKRQNECKPHAQKMSQKYLVNSTKDHLVHRDVHKDVYCSMVCNQSKTVNNREG